MAGFENEEDLQDAADLEEEEESKSDLEDLSDEEEVRIGVISEKTENKTMKLEENRIKNRQNMT